MKLQSEYQNVKKTPILPPQHVRPGFKITCVGRQRRQLNSRRSAGGFRSVTSQTADGNAKNNNTSIKRTGSEMLFNCNFRFQLKLQGKIDYFSPASIQKWFHARVVQSEVFTCRRKYPTQVYPVCLHSVSHIHFRF